jgi:UDP-N-acetyl-D-galactosamine dehydrogenase
MHDSLTDLKIGIIGLGYVGLPLAVEFGKKFPVLGFDINQARIAQLQAGHDSTLEVSDEELKDSPQLSFSSAVADLESCNIYIVTVPTPIDEHKQPDLTPLIKASEMLGKVVKKDDIIIYESTVYPGATEEACLPVVERYRALYLIKTFLPATLQSVLTQVIKSTV